MTLQHPWPHASSSAWGMHATSYSMSTPTHRSCNVLDQPYRTSQICKIRHDRQHARCHDSAIGSTNQEFHVFSRQDSCQCTLSFPLSIWRVLRPQFGVELHHSTFHPPSAHVVAVGRLP